MGKGYEVVKKEPIRKVSREGEVNLGFRIHAQTSGGTRYWVEVGDDQLDDASSMLEAKAKQLDGIK